MATLHILTVRGPVNVEHWRRVTDARTQSAVMATHSKDFDAANPAADRKERVIG